jgi:hypothetical protein
MLNFLMNRWYLSILWRWNLCIRGVTLPLICIPNTIATSLSSRRRVNIVLGGFLNKPNHPNRCLLFFPIKPIHTCIFLLRSDGISFRSEDKITLAQTRPRYLPLHPVPKSQPPLLFPRIHIGALMSSFLYPIFLPPHGVSCHPMP